MSEVALYRQSTVSPLLVEKLARALALSPEPCTLILGKLSGTPTLVKEAQGTPNQSHLSPSIRRLSRKVDMRLPGKGNPNSRGARPLYSFR